MVAEEAKTFLFVSVAGKRFALEVGNVREVLPVLEYAPVPHWPDSVLGLIDVRGELCILIDTGQALGQPPAKLDCKHLVVVVSAHGRDWGLLVTNVESVADAVPSAQKLAVPDLVEVPDVCGAILTDDRGTVLVLDPKSLIQPIRVALPDFASEASLRELRR